MSSNTIPARLAETIFSMQSAISNLDTEFAGIDLTPYALKTTFDGKYLPDSVGGDAVVSPRLIADAGIDLGGTLKDVFGSIGTSGQVFGSNGVATGYITPPDLNGESLIIGADRYINMYAFYATGEGTGAAGGLSFSTTPLNEGNHFNDLTGVYTAPLNGLYQFTLTVLNGSGTSNYLNIGVNSVAAAATTVIEPNKAGMVTLVVALNASDTVTHTFNSPLSTTANTSSFSGLLLRG